MQEEGKQPCIPTENKSRDQLFSESPDRRANTAYMLGSPSLHSRGVGVGGLGVGGEGLRVGGWGWGDHIHQQVKTQSRNAQPVVHGLREHTCLFCVTLPSDVIYKVYT